MVMVSACTAGSHLQPCERGVVQSQGVNTKRVDAMSVWLTSCLGCWICNMRSTTLLPPSHLHPSPSPATLTPTHTGTG